MSSGPERRVVRKVVGYVVHEGRLLVFTHDDVSLDVTGVQVPAGTIEPDESPEAAVVREVFEETGCAVRVVSALGIERYDVWPSKSEVHERHFFQLALVDLDDPPERWGAGEEAPSDGGVAQAVDVLLGSSRSGPRAVCRVWCAARGDRPGSSVRPLTVT
ncbi:NUDIX domain-containing protein [Microbacterium elymi]|uniref:NUDIX domain-containing protein n=1 Tax=Microbacterium elymi TaxID=2909587 RepID=UPI00338F52BC